MDEQPSHVDIYEEFWDLTRDWDKRENDCRAFAARCIELARARVPCIRDEMPHFPLVKAIAARSDDKYAELVGQVFAAYAENGYFDLETPVVISDSAPRHYREQNGLSPLEAAVRGGNVHTAQFLIRLGARTDIRPDGMDLFDFVRDHLGHANSFAPDAAGRQAASARLLVESMRRHVVTPATAAEPASPRRRRASV